MVKYSNIESGFWGHTSINGEMMKWWNGEENQYHNELHVDIYLFLGLSDRILSPWFFSRTLMIAILKIMEQLTWVIYGVFWSNSYYVLSYFYFFDGEVV